MPPPGGGSPRSLVIVTTVLILPILSPDRRGCPVFVENSHLGSGAATDELLCDRVPGSSASGGSRRRAGENFEVHQRSQRHNNAYYRDAHPL